MRRTVESEFAHQTLESKKPEIRRRSIDANNQGDQTPGFAVNPDRKALFPQPGVEMSEMVKTRSYRPAAHGANRENLPFNRLKQRFGGGHDTL